MCNLVGYFSDVFTYSELGNTLYRAFHLHASFSDLDLRLTWRWFEQRLITLVLLYCESTGYLPPLSSELPHYRMYDLSCDWQWALMYNLCCDWGYASTYVFYCTWWRILMYALCCDWQCVLCTIFGVHGMLLVYTFQGFVIDDVFRRAISVVTAW